LRGILFNVMLVAGVSTLVFNLNPLMRLDGYYIFSDLIEVPNLAQRANRYWGWLAEHVLFGADHEPPQSSAIERFWFALYAPASLVYRLSVTFAISLFLAEKWFFVGVVIALAGVIFAVFAPLLKGFWHVLNAPRLHRVRGRAIVVTSAALAALVGFLGLVPFPLHTTGEGVLWLAEDAYLRAGINGIVTAAPIAPGSQVMPGDLVLTSEDPQLVGDVEVQRAMVDGLRARYDAEQFADRVKADVTRQELSARLDSLRNAEQKARSLDIHAAIAGTLELPRVENMIGRYVKRGEILGYVIGGPARQVRVIVPQADIDLVNRGLRRAEALLPGELWRPVPMRLARQTPSASKTLPSRALAVDGGGKAQVDSRDAKAPKSLERWFQLDFDLDEPVAGRFGSRVFVRFEHEAEPLGWQLWRRGRQLFLSRLTS
jgi:putative peptide zinc metalloprotease protein